MPENGRVQLFILGVILYSGHLTMVGQGLAIPINTGSILLDSGPTLQLHMTIFVALDDGLSIAAVAFALVLVPVGEPICSFERLTSVLSSLAIDLLYGQVVQLIRQVL